MSLKKCSHIFGEVVVYTVTTDENNEPSRSMLKINFQEVTDPTRPYGQENRIDCTIDIRESTRKNKDDDHSIMLTGPMAEAFEKLLGNYNPAASKMYPTNEEIGAYRPEVPALEIRDYTGYSQTKPGANKLTITKCEKGMKLSVYAGKSDHGKIQFFCDAVPHANLLPGNLESASNAIKRNASIKRTDSTNTVVTTNPTA